MRDKLCSIPLRVVPVVAEVIADAHFNGPMLQDIGAVSYAGGFLHERILRRSRIIVNGDIFGQPIREAGIMGPIARVIAIRIGVGEKDPFTHVYCVGDGNFPDIFIPFKGGGVT